MSLLTVVLALLQGFKSLNKPARTLIQAIAAIDGNYYPEVRSQSDIRESLKRDALLSVGHWAD